MKNFNNYIKNKKKQFNKKIKLVTPIIDFMTKYKLDYLIIGNDDDNYHYEDISNKVDSFILSYEIYNGNKIITAKKELFDLDITFLENLSKLLHESGRLDSDIIFEVYRNYDTILNAFIVTKEKINISLFSFLEWMDVDDLDNDFPINSYGFQKTMFSHHPEVFDKFMVAIKQNKKNIEEGKYEFDDLILHPKIEKEYKDLLDKYLKKEKSNKFNI